MSVALSVTRIPGAFPVPLPSHQTDGSAGLDLCAESFDVGGARAAEIQLEPGDRVLARTGLAIAIPPGHAGLVCPRSGLALRHGLGVVNGPGVIDADYRGEVGVILVNHGRAPVRLERGMRVAQLVVVPFVRVEITEVQDLDATHRGAAGFGSTGAS